LTKAHDRVEMRRAIVVPAPGLAEAHGFPGAEAIGRVEGYRRLNGREEPAIVRHFILSRMVTGEEMIDIARTHWTIENQLHWVLDVAFDEDRARSRKDNAPQNLALMRKLALNLLRSNPDKGSIRGKIKRAAWDDAFLNTLLSHMR
jgi:predicted transposase YbfD/YdcC